MGQGHSQVIKTRELNLSDKSYVITEIALVQPSDLY